MSEEERRQNARARPIHLTLVSFAVTRKAYEVITERFAKEYEQATGVPVRFRLSFGGSGSQVCAAERSPPWNVYPLISDSSSHSQHAVLSTCHVS